MKAVILAGGLGTRLGKYTENLPKCMLEFAGKPLIQRQVDTFRKCGVENIIIVRKHLADKINISGVRYIDETDYSTRAVVGFFQARKEFNEDIIASYGDIIFEPRVLQKVLDSKVEVGVVADESWKDYWQARLGDWRKDSESFIINKNNKITSLGTPDPPEEDMNARYVGLIKFSKSALPKIERIYDETIRDFWNKPWQTSSSLQKSTYMHDLIRELIDRELDVRAVKIKHGWLELDTAEDYELARKWLEEGTLDRFIKLDDN